MIVPPVFAYAAKISLYPAKFLRHFHLCISFHKILYL